MSTFRAFLAVAATAYLGSLGCADAKRPTQPSAASPGPVGPSTSARPAGPGRGGRRLYDPSTFETLRGTVVRLEEVPSRRGFAEGLHLVLQKDDGAVLSVHLGPSWFLEEGKLSVSPGDQLEVSGSRVSLDGEVHLIARTVTKGAEALELRDPAGMPRWASARRGGAPAVPGTIERSNDMSSMLNAPERRALHDALDDEYKAWAIYDQVLHDFGDQRPFSNIRDAEARHIEALRSLFQRYGLEVPTNAWPGRVPRFASVREACQAAVTAEENNVAMYDRLEQSTTRADLLMVFENLRRASQERHRLAFQRCTDRGPRGGRR